MNFKPEAYRPGESETEIMQMLIIDPNGAAPMLAASESTSTETSTPPASAPSATKRAAIKRPAKTASKQKTAAPKKVAKPAAKKVAVVVASGSGTPLKTLCGKLGLETKLARRKLRAAKFDWHGHRERWTFNAKQLAKATEILSA